MNMPTVGHTPYATDWSRAVISNPTSESFLVLLAAQLQHQDPLDPMTGESMLNQISQLTSVSQLTLLNRNFEALATAQRVTEVASLLGRTVEWADPATNEMRSGVVSRVQVGAGGWQVCVGDQSVSVHDIVSVE